MPEKFLKWLHPDTAWFLAALDGEKWSFVQFMPEQADAAREWIQNNLTSNVYFQPAVIGKNPKKGKAAKSDVAHVTVLWCDVDLKDEHPHLAWGDPTAVKAAADVALKRISAHNPPPTLVWWTGGGYQALWRLSTTLTVEECEPLLKGIRARLLGDPAVAQAASMLRLPETVNVLNDKKRAMGRAPCPVSIVWECSHINAVYAPEQFDADAPEPMTFPPARAGGGRPYDELLATLPDNLRRDLQREGEDRSAHCFNMEMKLFRRGLSAPEVLTVMERSACAAKFIKAGTLAAEVGRAAGKRAERENQRRLNIELGNLDVRGETRAELLTLDAMCQRFVWVADGQYVARLDSPTLLKASDAAAMHSASKATVKNAKGEEKRTSCFSLWQAHPDRKTVSLATWGPGRPIYCPAPVRTLAGENAINMWRGFMPLMCPPDWESYAKIFDDHVEYLIPIEEERKHFLQWLGHIVQKPGELPHTAYVMVTETTGIGRNSMASMLVRAMRGYVAAGVDLRRILEKDFNGSISQKVLCIVDEAHEGMDGARKYENSNTLKRIITEEHRLINPKYGAQHYEFNCARWLMFSNYDDCVPFTDNDRRLRFIKNPTVKAPKTHYNDIYKYLEHPFLAASVFQRLATVDLSTFNPGDEAPWNAQKMLSLEAMTSDVDQSMRDFLQEWPGDFAATCQVRRFVLEDTGTFPDSKHLKHAMRRAGIRPTGRRLLWRGSKERLVILRNLEPEHLTNADPRMLTRMLEEFEAKAFPPSNAPTIRNINISDS